MARKISKKEIIKKIDDGFRKSVAICERSFTKSKGKRIQERLQNSCIKGSLTTALAIQEKFKV